MNLLPLRSLHGEEFRKARKTTQDRRSLLDNADGTRPAACCKTACGPAALWILGAPFGTEKHSEDRDPLRSRRSTVPRSALVNAPRSDLHQETVSVQA